MLKKEDTDVISYSQTPRRCRITSELTSTNDQYLDFDYEATQVSSQWKKCLLPRCALFFENSHAWLH